MAKTNSRSAPTRQALMEATLRTAAREGISGVTYRKVVQEANLSLGTASYHFDDFDDLIRESFAYFVEQISDRYEEKLRAASNKEELIEAVIELSNAMRSDDNDSVLLLTLYSEAARNPALADLVKTWSRETKRLLRHVVDDAMATQLELVWDGAMLQRSTFDHGLTDAEIRELLRRIVDL